MDSKKLFAFIAIAMMVCAALVPFANTSSSVGDDTDANTNEAVVSLYDILNSLNDIGTGKTIALNGMTLVPTDDEFVGETKTIDSPVTSSVIVEDGQVFTITGDYVFGNGAKANNGKITVQEGGKICFCNPNVEGSFSIQNKNIGSTNLILAESGAYISILGLTFKVYCGGSDSSRLCVPIISLIGTNKSVVTFSSTYTDGKHSFGITVPDVGYSKLTVFGLVDFHEGTSLMITDMNISFPDNKTMCVSNGHVDMTIKDGRYTYYVKSTGSNTSGFTLKMESGEQVSADGVKTVTTDITLSADFKFDKIESKFKASSAAEETTTFEVTDFALSASNLVGKVVNKITDSETTKKRDVSMSCDISLGTGGKIALSIAQFVKNDTIGNIPVEFTFKGIGVEISGLSISFSDHTTGIASHTRDLDTFYSNIDMKLKVDTMDANVEVVWWKLSLAHIKAIDSSIEGITTVYDATKKVFATSVGTFYINAKLAPSVSTVSGDESMLSVLVTVSNLVLTQKEGQNYVNLKFDALTDISVNYDGERHMAIAVNGFDGILGDESVSAIKIASLALKNDIPFSKAMIVGLFEQNCIGYLTATGLEITESDDGVTIKGKTFDAQCNTIVDGIADIVAVTMNSGYTIYVSDNIVIESSLITGFLKNIGDNKEQYTIKALSSSAPAKMTISGVKKPYFVWQVKLESCSSTFGAGLLPADLIIASGSSFRANGLSAFDFTFESGSTVSGNVTFDLTDKLIYPERKIVAGDKTLTVKIAGDVGEYALTLDLGNMKGTVDAKKGFKVIDGKAKTFNFDKNMELTNYCEAYEFYNIYSEDGTVLKSLQCNQTWVIDLDGEWTDGSGKTYKKGETYTMPAKNVTFTKVVTKTAEVTEVGEKTVAYADSQSVEVPGQEIVGKDVIVVVDDAAISIDKETLKNIGVDAINDKLTVSMIKVTDMDDTTSKIVGDSTLYSIVLKVNDVPVTEYNRSTNFEVTVNVAAAGIVEGFNVSYMDSTGHLTSVEVTSIEKCVDGTYNVSFKTNHFSDFVIDPITAGLPEMEEIPKAVVALVAVTLALIMCYGAYDYIRGKKDKN